MKKILVLCLFSLTAVAAEPMPNANTSAATKGDIVANPSGKTDDLPEAQAVKGWQKGYNQTLKLQMKDLKVMADFPLNSRHPFQISGFDNQDSPYTLEVRTTKKSDKTFHVEYLVTRGNKKESASLTVEKGKIGKIETNTKDILDPVVVFETKITN